MSSDASPLFTVDDVRALLEERAKAAAVVAECDKKLSAVRLLLGETRMALLFGEAAPQKPTTAAPSQGPSVRAVIEDALKNAPKGMTYDELREAVGKAGLANTIEKSPNNFYNAIARLKKLRGVVTVGNRAITSEALDRLSDDERQALEEDEPSSGMSIIYNVVKDFGRPLMPGVCIELVQDVDPSIRAPRIYAALSRLVQRGQLAKASDGRYYVPGVTEEKPLL